MDVARASTFLLFGVIAGLGAGCNPVRAIEANGIDGFRKNSEAKANPAAHVQELSDRVGPRPCGSLNDAKAVAWALEKMKALGLQNVHAETVTVPRWERGEEHAEIIAPVEEKLTITALGGSVETPADGLQGEVIEVPSIEALDSMAPEAVRGKIVFVNTVTERTRNFEGYARSVNVRRDAAVSAAKKGAAGAVIRSISTGNSRFPHTGYMKYDDAVSKIPVGALSVPDAMMLSRLIKGGVPVKMRMTLASRRLPEVESANVVGDVVGSERPAEIVLLGAHLDSWDLGTGALDDGAGVGMVLEAGNLLTHAAERPLRTVRIVLFSNEEFGLSGGIGYASAHQAELGNHVLAMEADMGAGGAYAVTFHAAPSAARVFNELSAPLVPLGIGAATPSEHHGSDLYPLEHAGVPMADITQDVSTYFDYHHSADDTFDKIDPPTLAQATTVLSVFAYAVSHSTEDLGRLPPPK